MTAAQEIPVPEPVLREDQLDYTPTAASVPLSRHRAARLVLQWGHPELAGDAALLVSELMTNALLHGSVRGRLLRVHLTLTAATLRIAVSDPRGERMPGVREADDEECYGRGLMVISCVSDRFGVESRIVGKTVYAELDLHQAPDTPMGPRSRRAGPPQTRTTEAVTPR